MSKLLLSCCVLSICLLAATPGEAKVWDDDRKGIIDALDSLLTSMNEGKDSVSAPNIQKTFSDAGKLLKETLPSKAQMNAFENGGCEDFKDDLSLLLGAMFDLGQSLSDFHELAIGLNMSDPGIANLIPKIPCSMLLPVSLVSDKLGLVNDGLNDTLISARDDLTVIKALIYPPNTATGISAFDGHRMSGIGNLETPDIANSCPIIKENPETVKISYYSVLGLGYISTALGTLLQVIGKSAVAGPDEVQVEIWGWVGSRIRNSPAMMAGKFFSGLGDALLAASGAVSRIRKYCALRDDHQVLQRNQMELMLVNQSLQNGQEEIIRLLLTPQGRRISDFCHDEQCENQDFPRKH